MAVDSYSSYLHCIGGLASAAQRNNRCIKAEHSEASNNLSVENDQDTVCTSHQVERGLPNTFSLSLSHFALVFVHENDSGKSISSLSMALQCNLEKLLKYLICYYR